MRRSIRHHIRANVIGYLALFFALSAGAYASGLAPNSVKSKHIKDGQVRSQDVASDSTPYALTGQNVLNNSLTGQDVANESLDGSQIHGLTGADLQPNTLGGAQIDESSLGTVAMAAQGGTGRYGYTGSCDPESYTYVACTSVQVPHARPGRLLVIGEVTAQDETGASHAYGACRLEVNEQPIGASPVGFSINAPSDYTNESSASPIAVTDVLPAGSQWVGIACNQATNGYGEGAIVYPSARIVGVSLSDG
jgi:hypothetical protein